MPPTMLLNSLEGVRRRVRALSVVYGIGIVVAAAVGMLLATVLLDYLLDLRPVPRIVVILTAMGCTGYVAARWVLRPFLARLRLSDVAGRIEHAFPAFDDRLRSTIDFVDAGTPGSEFMKRRVVDQATEMAANVNLNRAVRTKPVWESLGAGLGSVVLCVALALFVSPQYLHAAVSRLLTPFDGLAWPKRTEIEVVGAVPQRIPVGRRLDVRVKLAKGDKPNAVAVIYYRYEENGPVQQEKMTRGADGTYVASLDAKTELNKPTGAMQIWVRSDDDRKDLPTVQVVEQLAIKGVEAVVTPPKYADLPPASIDLSSSAGTVTVGSDVAIKVTFNKPLAAGQPVRLESVDRKATSLSLRWDEAASGSSSAVGHFLAKEAVHFRVRATDVDGFSNAGIEEYQILVRPDQPPTVEFEKPTRNEECTPEATLPIQALAQDDFGIMTLKMVVTRVADKKAWTIDLVREGKGATSAAQWQKLDGSADRVRFRMNWGWDLAKLDAAPLKPGDQLDFFLRAQDNYADENGRPHDPPYSESGHLRVTIISQATLTQQINDVLNQYRNEADDVRKKNEGVRASTKGLKEDTEKKPAMDRADQQLAGQLANDQSTAASQAKQIADKLGDVLDRLKENKSPNNDTANNVAEAQKLLNNAAENPMRDAAAKLGDVKDQKADPKAGPDQQKKDADDRNAALDQAQKNQADATAKLQAAMDKMGSATGVSEFLKQISDLLDAQKKLSDDTANAGKGIMGKKDSELTPEEKKALKEIADRQAELAKQADQAIKSMSDAGDKQSKADPASAQALKQAATTGQQQNVSGNMTDAAKSAQQNQQASAQTSQKQVELGLLMMLRQLKEAENRKLMELLKQLDTAQQLLADLIQQQAGHNLDNLGLQGGNALAEAIKADPELIKSLIEYSGRDPQRLPPPPALETQVALQAQTESNTRHDVSVIEALPEGAEAAAHLTRAAQRMSRAVTYLQDKQLTDAYQPPQVEALGALLAAKQNVDEQMKKAQDKLQDQQKEALRTQFIKIRDEQVKLNSESKAIDAGPRAPDGEFGHEARARLGMISDRQSDLAKKTAKLDDDLVSVGSIAYTYANDDIVAKMNKVKDGLARLDPGAKTQVVQARIVRQLDDMIKDLAIKPKQSDFHNPRGGDSKGGGGGKAPKLPPEAEIRLIQDLQKALNDDTKDADAAGIKDKSDILQLGKRQGDLRKLLDDVLQKASDGKVSLGPEPANKDALPEEAKDDDLDLEELKDQALNAKPDEKGIKDDTSLVGIRMARARQRLSMNADAGTTTQKIQERIVINLDALAKMAQQQQAQASPKPGKGQPGQRPGQGPPNGQKPGNDMANGEKSQGPKSGEGGSTPAGSSASGGPGPTDADINAQLADLKESWGKMSPRERAAVMEGATEKTIGKFENFVNGYYRTLATKASQ